jgi:serine/threonine protein kinase/outer membrane biosynthesis protein TonB
MSDPVSQLWKDRYLIEKELARGGFGVVYLARDQRLLSKSVVVKVLLEGMDPDPYIQKKFRQEIEALARIDHPGIVGVLDVGDTPEGKPFLVMQFVEGVTLRSQIDKGGMALSAVARIMRQIGNALTAAHEKGVLHRDLKPENIMLQTLGEGEVQVKLIDFGIAAVKDSQVDHTQLTSKVAGTLSYMAPEQVLGHASQASDLYALGVIAFEMITGIRPENSPQGVQKKPRELRPELNDTAQSIILSALSYRPELRQSRVREFTDRLAEALGETISGAMPLATGKSSSLQSSGAGLEMAYVLFMDLVDYSKLPMDQQTSRIQQLQAIVRGAPEFQEASANDRLISLPTGDGMALVFFQNPVTPVQCATGISRALRLRPELRLRMGVHTGPVYRIADINANKNVTGGGINLAQRVMDCGDAGHILLSKTFADVLVQLSDWADSLHDLGEVAVKHGANVHLVNLYDSDFGNPALPSKVAAARSGAPVRAAAPVPEKTVVAPVSGGGRSGVGIGIAAVAVVVIAAMLYFGFFNTPPQTSDLAALKETDTPAPPVTPPPPPVALPTKTPEPAKAQDSPAKPPAEAKTEPAPGTPAPTPGAAPAVSKAAEPAPHVTPSPPPAAAPSPTPPQGGGRRGRGQPVPFQIQNRVRALMAIRQNMAAAREEFFRLMKVATAAISEGDYDTAAKTLELANQELTKVEGAIRRGTAPRGQ